MRKGRDGENEKKKWKKKENNGGQAGAELYQAQHSLG